MLAIAGCGGSDNGDQPSRRLDTLRPGTLRVGSEVPYPPFEFGRPPDYQGFDIDFVNEVAKRLDLNVELKPTPFETILNNLARGKYDAVVSATTILPEREKIVDFSHPYFAADQALTVKQGSGITTVQDLDGRRVGAQSATTGAKYATEKTKANVRTYEQIDDAFNALQAGQIDVVVHDFPVSKYTERTRKGLKVVQTIPTGEMYGIAFAERSDRLREAVNVAIDDIKRGGTYKRIYNKWFQAAPPEGILKTG